MQKVTDPALLAQLNGGGQASAPRPMQPTTPGIIVGRQKAPDPYRVDQDRISNENEAERLRLAQKSAALAAAKAAADEDDRARKLAAGPVADAREGEANNAAFAGRARKALDEYNAAETELGGPRSDVGGLIAAIPGGERALRMLPDSVGDSPTRRTAERAKLDFVNLILRSDSGAAVPEEEVARALKTYFPSPGETEPAVLESYRQAREGALEGLRMKAGRLAGPEGGAALPAAPGALPDASRGRQEPNAIAAGVQDAGKGGLSPVPEFRGMASEVKSLVQQGASAEQVLDYVTKRHVDAGYGPPNAERAQFIRDVVADHQRDPRVPVGSLANFNNLEMVENPNTGGTILGSLADTSVGAGAIGAADVVTGGYLDEIAGVLGGNTDNARAVMAASAAERPVSTFAGNVVGGALLPTGRATSAAGLAGTGAAYGGLYGSGSANGDLDSRAVGALGGAALGGLTGGLVGKTTNALASRGVTKNARQTERNALLQDFTDQGITPMPANVAGAPTRLATSGAAQTYLSSGFISKAAGRQADEFGEAVGKNAGRAGSKMPVDEAGSLAKRAGERYSRETSERGSKLYERAYNEAGDIKIVPTSAIAEIDSKIARLAQSPDPEAAALVKELTSFKGKLEQGVSVVGLRDARTRLSQGVYGGKLRANADQQVYRDILGKVSDDIETGLRDGGKGRAAGMFRTADKYWSERVDYIDEVLQPIIGKGRSGEDILTSIEGMAGGRRGGVDRLRGVMRSLSDEERGSVQATIIDRMGKANKGQQNADNSTFSAASFLTRWNDLSDKGKLALFGNSDLRQSLDQLARVSSNLKDSGKYTNTSNTAGAVGFQGVLSGGALWAGGLPAVVLGGGSQLLTGALLASPKFAGWLARAPKNPTPAAAKAYVGRLKNIAAAEPVIASDIGKLAQFMNAANDVSPNVAVAAPERQQEDN